MREARSNASEEALQSGQIELKIVMIANNFSLFRYVEDTSCSKATIHQ